MKRQLAIISFISLFAAFIFSYTLIVGGCGDGGGGGGVIIGGGGLATGTFTKTDVLDDGSGPNTGVFGMNPFRHYQLLYRAQEINGSGNITTVWLRLDQAEAAAISCPNTTIKLGHSSVTDLSTNMTNNVEQGRGSLVTVVNDATIVIPSGAAGDYFDIPLETPFNYNGVDNLVLDITRVTTCSDTAEIRWTAETIAFVNQAYSADSGNPDTAGSIGNYAFDAKFTFAGGDNPPFAVGGPNEKVPFTSDTNGQRVQQLYLSSDIDGSGPITGVGIEVGVLTTEQTYTVSVKLGHTTVSTLDTDYDANYSGSPKTVANAVTFTVPAGVPVDSYVWIPLTGSFNYNGTDNLILEFVVSSGTGDTRWTYHDHGSGDVRLIFGPSDASVINPINTAIQHPKFRFNGGTMDVLTPDGMTGGWGDNFPFFSPDGRRQWLYRAAELGTKGTINKIAGRAWSLGGAADTGFTYTIFMSHTTATTLGTDFAANLPSPVTVFNGTLNIPAVSGGDWYEIPLSKPFNYNGTDNLVVEIGGTGGTGVGAPCIVDIANTTLYTSRRLWALSSTDATGNLNNALIDMRFMLK